LREGTGKRRFVKKIAGHKWAGDKAAVASRKIIVDDRLVPGRSQGPATMRTDIAGAAGNQNNRTTAHAKTLN
jgi:hypothetical protein